MRAIAVYLLSLVLGFLPLSSFQTSTPSGEEKAVLRALLVGCDFFADQEDTWPAAAHNLGLVQQALEGDGRGYGLIRAVTDEIASPEQLEEAVRDTFQGAGKEDISLLYLSTHGVFDDGMSTATAALILSDGETDRLLYAPALEKMLDQVPGTKVLILDACNSGAFIGKGLSGGADRVCFSGPQYRVLCSAGGSEASWYFQQSGAAAASGASYFATVLADGLGAGGDYAADVNRDGRITLREIYDYLLENYAASTPQVYPQNDGEFALLTYDPQAPREIAKAVTGLTIQDTLLTAGQSRVTFSFTVRRPVELYYQVVYHENGVWQFAQAQHFLDGEGEEGLAAPGRKERTLLLDTGQEDASGYVMIQLLTREEGRVVFQGARLLCVQPAAGDVDLRVATDPAFLPGIGQELCILAQHDVPCALSVNILDASGKVIRRLAYETPSRPQQLTPNASSFYWDGRDSRGQPAPAGLYTVQLRVRLGDQVFLRESAPVELISLEDETTP